MGALCKGCPLAGRPLAPPQSARKAAKLVVLGTYPRASAIATEKPFAGIDGQLLHHTLHAHGLDRFKEVHVTNAILCRPRPHMTGRDMSKARAHCRPRLVRELASVAKGTTVMVMGKEALLSVFKTGKEAVRGWRGYPLDPKELHPKIPTGLNYMPTYHPRFILQGGTHHLPFYKLDWQRGMAINGKKNVDWGVDLWPPRIIDGGAAEIAGLKRMLAHDGPIAVDVENGGDGHPIVDPLLCIGLGTPEFAVTVRWPARAEAEALLREIFDDTSRVLVYQHNNHDRLSLWAHGLEPKAKTADTLNAGCVIASKAYHDLGTVANFFKFRDRWKTKFHSGDDKKGAKAFTSKPYPDLAKYNGQDCIGTAETWEAQQPAIDAIYRGRELYDDSIRLSNVGYEMTKRGVLIDTKRRIERIAMFKRLATSEEGAFMQAAQTRALPELPKDFWQTAKGKRKDGTAKRWIDKAKNGPSDLFYNHLNVDCTHFSPETGANSLSKNAIRDMMGSDRASIADLARTLFMYRQWDSSASQIGGMVPLGEVLHPLWSAALKATRRWGSSPNMQNIPYHVWELLDMSNPLHARMLDLGVWTRSTQDGKRELCVRPGFRDLIIARPGMMLVSSDYSQLELRILALLAKDEILLEAYAAGKDVHAVNTTDLFGVTQADVPKEEWKKLRRLAKSFVYGANYGAAWRTVYLNLLPDFPGLQPELIETLYEKWFETHHWIVDYQQRQIAFARQNSYVECFFSGHRFHFFWGMVKPTYAINFPIQTAASHIVNQAVLKLQGVLSPEEKILMNVHDELVAEGPEPHVLGRKMDSTMRWKLSYKGIDMDFPVEPIYGKNWEPGEMEACEL